MVSRLTPRGPAAASVSIAPLATLKTPFFFQAEDGIRDRDVTGVQTCALPIWGVNRDRAKMSILDLRPQGGVDMTATWHKTACNLCYVNCGIEVLVNEGRVEKVRGDRSSPKSQGYLCNKAARIPYYAHHKDRLTTPLRRRADGGFDAIKWDVAIAEIAERVRTLVDRHGGKSMALYGGGGQGNHAGGAYANAFLRALGSRNVFNALSQEKT